MSIKYVSKKHYTAIKDYPAKNACMFMACMGCGLGGLCAVIFVWTFQPGLVTVSATVTAGIAYAAFSIFAIYAAYRAGIRNDEKAQEGLKSLRMYTGDTYTLDPAKSADYLIIPDSWRDEL